MRVLLPLLRKHIGTIQLVIILTVLCAVIFTINPRFLSAVNISNLLGQMVTLLIVSLGMTIIIISGEFDISVGSLVGLTGAVMGWMMIIMPANYNTEFWQQHQNVLIFTGIIVSLLVGPVFATLSGILVTKLVIPSFIVTLGMLMMGRSLTLVITGGQPIAGIPDALKSFGVSRPIEIPFFADESVLRIPSTFLVAVLIYFLGWFLMSRMAFGRRVYAVGANPIVARLAGINTNRTKLTAFAIVGLCSSIAGVLNTARIGAVSPNSGQGLEFEVIAAVVIGGTSLSGGKGNVLGTILGVIIIVLIRNFLNLARIDIFWQDFATGAIIMGAVVLNALQKRISGQAL